MSGSPRLEAANEKEEIQHRDRLWQTPSSKSV
jgi:hypothetical protein